MKISVIHPSRSRPEMAYSTANKWIERAGMEVEYIFSLDRSDPKLKQYLSNPLGDSIMYCNDNKSAIQAINEAAKICTGDLIVIVSDDFDCPFDWALYLSDNYSGMHIDDFIIKTPDGIQPTIITLPILSRKYYESFGYVYYPEYQHMFCDTEMTAVAHMTGKVIESDIIFRHNHYIVGGMKKDAINIKNDATWQQGEKLFKERLAVNFGLKDEEIVKPYDQIRWK